MMNLQIQTISNEIIKPSSPTPHHLRNLKLSFLDQLAPPIYVPIILFYNAESDQNVDHFERSSWLKKSLAETLVHFYPLAGIIKEDLSIECNDEGIEYVEVHVPCKLSYATEKLNANDLNQFLPFEPYDSSINSKREVLLAVQYNIFECGGVAIGVCASHKIADGTSVGTFVNAWASICRGASEAIVPIFDAATHFPPRDITGFMPNIIIMNETIVTKRFVFDKSNIDALREVASSADGSQVKAPTRVEAVSAFIWGRFLRVARSKPQRAKVFAAVHAVNLRDRMVPTLPMQSFGNLWRAAIAPSTLHIEQEYHMLVSQMRNAIKKINCDYVKKLQSGDGYMDLLKMASEQLSKGEIEFCNFTSWCRFPVYEVDFGWGKPTWVCSPSRPYKNLVVLMSTKSGDGIEAWVNMLKEDMAIFECDPELLSYVSSTLSE